MNVLTKLSLCCISLLSVGCAAMTADRQQMLSYQAADNANWFSSLFNNPCAFGGMDSETSVHCGKQNFGVDGEMVALNSSAIERVGPKGDCKDHVSAVLEMARAKGLSGERLYSCPNELEAELGVCHVSAIVEASDGVKWLLDNGTIVDSTTGAGGAVVLSEAQELLAEFPSGTEQAGLKLIGDYVVALRAKK